MKYLSLFSGIGGFELGIQRALPTAECVGYSEIDKYASSVYDYHFNHRNYGDATRVNPSELPDFDTIVGGFPCQAFSIAGNRKGFGETRGTLFFDIARICADKRPRHLVLENVKGLLNHEQGKTFTAILGVLADLGYRTEWMVFNSKAYVPQSRERVYIIGHLADQCAHEILPIAYDSTKDFGGTESKFAGALLSNYYKNQRNGGANYVVEPFMVSNVYGGFKESEPRVHRDISPTIRANTGGGHLPSVVEPVIAAQRKRGSEQRLEVRSDFNSNSLTLATTDNYVLVPDNTKQGFSTALPGDTINTSHGTSKTRRGRVAKQIAHTLDTTSGTYEHVVDPKLKIRRLTPIECERLQGFDDDWTSRGRNIEIPEGVNGAFSIISDTQRYKMCGNAVTVNVVAAVFDALAKSGCVE